MKLSPRHAVPGDNNFMIDAVREGRGWEGGWEGGGLGRGGG